MRKSLIATFLLAACGHPGGNNLDASAPVDASPPPDAGPAYTLVKDTPFAAQRAVDLLFVIDNAGVMKEAQAALGQSLPALENSLGQATGGLPDLHVGVVSTEWSGCEGVSDAGQLLRGAPTATCDALDANARFVSDVATATGDRVRNYTGDLAPLLACMSVLGTDGCRVTASLSAIRAALDPATVANAGFLRPDAVLAIVVLSAKDDSSVSDPALYSPTAPLGPYAFRATEFGVMCDGDADPLHMQTRGVRSNCAPREDSAFVYPVQRYVDFVRGLKADPRDVVVAAIGGPATPFAIVNDPTKPLEPFLAWSCESASDRADPAVRLAAFAHAFPRSSTASICTPDLSDALVAVAGQVKEAMGDRCLDGPFTLADADPATAGLQPDCVVAEALGATERALPMCAPFASGTHGNTPCWFVEADPVTCGSSAAHLAVRTDYGAAAPAFGAHLTMRCVLD